MCRLLFIGISRIWWLLAIPSVSAEMKNGVIVQRTGQETLFVFPPEVQKPSGRITVGKTIEVMYFMKVGGGNARFISMNAGTTHQSTPNLRVDNKEGPTMGFYIKDTAQPMMDVHIDPKFTHDINKKTVQTRIGREGNLKVSLGKSEKGVTITRVDIN